MSLRSSEPKSVVFHAHPQAFVARTHTILSRLGYQLLTPEEFDALSDDGELDLRQPHLRIVDERRLAEVSDDPGDELVPIIVLSGRHGVTGADGRIIGAVKKPAGLHDLYRLMQLVFEENPRSVPRIPTHLRTTCNRHGREWGAAILSLSENGCLLRTPEPLPLGTELDVSFELPRLGRIELHADVAYQFLPDLGLVFSAVEPTSRDAIGNFVSETLTQ